MDVDPTAVGVKVNETVMLPFDAIVPPTAGKPLVLVKAPPTMTGLAGVTTF